MRRSEAIEAAARALREADGSHGVYDARQNREAGAALDAALALPADPVPEPSERERALVREAFERWAGPEFVMEDGHADRIIAAVDRTHPRATSHPASAVERAQAMRVAEAVLADRDLHDRAASARISPPSVRVPAAREVTERIAAIVSRILGEPDAVEAATQKVIEAADAYRTQHDRSRAPIQRAAFLDAVDALRTARAAERGDR